MVGAAGLIDAGTLRWMSTLPSSDADGGDPVRRRPPTVDYAVYAIVARSLFAVLSAFAAYLARDEFTRSLAKSNPSYSAAKLHDTVSTSLRLNILQTAIFTLLILLIAKFIRDGKSWARWVFIIMSLLITGDVLRVTAFFTSGNVIYRICIGMTGVASIAAIVFLFLRPSRVWFVRPGASPLSLGSMFSPRAPRIPPTATTAPAGRPSLRKQPPTAGPASPPPVVGRPPAPRAKSRRPNAE